VKLGVGAEELETVMRSQDKTITLPNVERHWQYNEAEFSRTYSAWIGVFGDLISQVSDVLHTLAGRRALAENCSYLMFSKGLNHSLAMYSLIRRGLCIDAALSARNAVETLLLLELCATDSSEKLFRQWSDGKSFQPRWVRKQLASRKEVALRDVIISSDSQTHDLHSFVYKWLSEITHANLRSLDYSVAKSGANGFDMLIAGSVVHSRAFINAMFAVVSHVLLNAAALCCAIFSLEHLEDNRGMFQDLAMRVDSVS
jgi:hypothetical protein